MTNLHLIHAKAGFVHYYYFNLLGSKLITGEKKTLKHNIQMITKHFSSALFTLGKNFKTTGCR